MVGNVMNEMASRIEKQLADQRALLATVSHEIRTPLSRMRLLIEFAREKTESNMARLADAKDSLGDLTEIEREVTEIDALVSDLLASSRIDFTALTASKLEAIAVGKTALEARLGWMRRGRKLPQRSDRVRGRRHTGGAGSLQLAREREAPRRRSRGPCASNRDQVSSRSRRGQWAGVCTRRRNPRFRAFYKGPSSDAAEASRVGLGLALVKKNRRSPPRPRLRTEPCGRGPRWAPARALTPCGQRPNPRLASGKRRGAAQRSGSSTTTRCSPLSFDRGMTFPVTAFPSTTIDLTPRDTWLGFFTRCGRSRCEIAG